MSTLATIRHLTKDSLKPFYAPRPLPQALAEAQAALQAVRCSPRLEVLLLICILTRHIWGHYQRAWALGIAPLYRKDIGQLLDQSTMMVSKAVTAFTGEERAFVRLLARNIKFRRNWFYALHTKGRHAAVRAMLRVANAE